MSSDFEGYEQDFAVLTAEITNKIARVPRLPPDEKKQMVANVEKQLEEAKELLEQMDLEVREIPPQSRGMYSNRMRSYKQEMGKLETDFKRSRIAYSDEVRNELLGDDGNSSENQLIKLREERAHLLDNTERLERSSRRLEAGYQIAVETACSYCHTTPPPPLPPLMGNQWTSSFGDQALQSLENKLARRCWKTSVTTEKRYREHVKGFGKQMLTWGRAPGFSQGCCEGRVLSWIAFSKVSLVRSVQPKTRIQ
ncbi:vesicle transport through interaction with t-SNAREs homolog 1A isoform X5 [Bos indicus]|uniref:Vesicle transport through interaction with t-SNAREs homolog 1A isoform X5 n=1 Tax=Bos indicus TaxID=9915 RepID=A0ABM4RPB7_BOSIN|nr:vesicle transport through interaction with t-SNAREs homolog 1A isoform X6 [Bos taurus]